ncbi:DUF6944 family repetitive protein [Rossellomorea oryzaecorticis]|jgi:hypothetical protein|uniref:DUF6944 family repetitive protein n=1 Tax=Rossellomorea oryzaecorticis TaxID=1396505 RepID=A0ABW8VL16_9BACI
MGNEFKATFGAWVQAVGTVLSAIGNTPSKSLSDDTLTNLDIIGNEMQATGNALEADAIKNPFDLTKIGNQVQSIGNLTVLSGLVFDFNEVTKQELDIKGNLLQALGGSAAVADSLDEERTLDELLSIYGNALQVIGNSLQAISGILELNNEESGDLNVIGSWIQAVGAVLSALVQSPGLISASESNS